MTRARDVANLIGSGNFSSTTFTATAGQTVFSIAHTQNFVQVFMNGLLLDLTTDYTSNGSAITLTSGAAAGDEIEVVKYNTFSVGDALNQAAADTRFVNVTGDSMTGNLGINETSPSGSLHVKGTSSTHGKIILEAGGSGGSANNNFMEFNKHDGTKLGELEVGESVTNGGSLVFKTTPSGGSATTRMTINHDGQITTPSNPAFRVYNTASQQASSSDEIITWQAEELDRGGNFASNVFTAPVTGVYSFNCQFLSTNNSAQTTLYIKVGSSSVSYARSALTASNNHRTTNLSWIGTVTAGTAVGVYISDSGAYIYGDASGDWTHFQGFLIG